MRRLIPLAIMTVVSSCSAQAPQSQAFDVFFESNRVSLTSESRSIVDLAAIAARQEPPARIVVQGSATGTTPRDAKLASERADAVISALVAANVDPTRIQKESKLVPTTTPIVMDRIAVQRVQIELMPGEAVARRTNREGAQSAQLSR